LTVSDRRAAFDTGPSHSQDAPGVERANFALARESKIETPNPPPCFSLPDRSGIAGLGRDSRRKTCRGSGIVTKGGEFLWNEGRFRGPRKRRKRWPQGKPAWSCWSRRNRWNSRCKEGATLSSREFRGNRGPRAPVVLRGPNEGKGVRRQEMPERRLTAADARIRLKSLYPDVRYGRHSKRGRLCNRGLQVAELPFMTLRCPELLDRRNAAFLNVGAGLRGLGNLRRSAGLPGGWPDAGRLAAHSGREMLREPRARKLPGPALGSPAVGRARMSHRRSPVPSVGRSRDSHAGHGRELVGFTGICRYCSGQRPVPGPVSLGSPEA